MLIVFGDSHVIALRSALLLMDAKERSVIEQRFGKTAAGMVDIGIAFQRPFFEDSGKGVRLASKPARLRFAKIAGDAKATIRPGDPRIFGLCFGLHAIPLLRHPMWSEYTIDPDEKERTLLSSAVFKDLVYAQAQPALAFSKRLEDLGVKHFFIAACPLRRNFHDARPQHGSLEQKVRFIAEYQGIVAAELHRRGIPLITPPAGTAADGVLKPEYEWEHEGDRHHANAGYGKRMWDKIMAEIATSLDSNASGREVLPLRSSRGRSHQ